MTDPSRPYQPPETAAQQTMQQPQSGIPGTTGGAGHGSPGPLPQGPGHDAEQAGSASLTGLVAKLEAALGALGLSAAGGNQLQDVLSQLKQAASQADQALKQHGQSQYPASPQEPTPKGA